MKKQNLFLLLLAALCLVNFQACKKEIAPAEKELSGQPGTTVRDGRLARTTSEFNAEEFAMRLLPDQGFVTFWTDYTRSLYKIRKAIEPSSEHPDGFYFLDEAEAEGQLDKNAAAWGAFAESNQDFFLLSTDEQNQVMSFIQEAWRSPEFREQHPETFAPIIAAGTALAEELNASGRTGYSARITANELIGCALEALVGAVAGYADAISDIRYIIRQGWSGAELVRAATSIIKNASPWWKVGLIALDFGACLWGAAD